MSLNDYEYALSSPALSYVDLDDAPRVPVDRLASPESVSSLNSLPAPLNLDALRAEADRRAHAFSSPDVPFAQMDNTKSTIDSSASYVSKAVRFRCVYANVQKSRDNMNHLLERNP